MKTRVLACVCGVLAAWPLRGATAQTPILTPRDSALHALNRLAYGPRPGEVDRVAAAGVMQWIDRQLSPSKIDDHALAERERAFDILDYDRGDLAKLYLDAERERRERKRAAGADSAERPDQNSVAQRERRLGGEFADLAVVRAALSERQLYEVMVDFWTNHFNVFLAKGADRFLTPSYIEQTIRPRALSKFEDLLIATAKSPAMLFYLDNWESVAPGSMPPQAMRLRARPLFGPRPMFGRPPLFDPGRDPMRADSLRRQAAERMPKGINENYARELLELHTLGVDGAVAAWRRSHGDIRDVLRAIFRSPDFWAPENARAKIKTPLEFVVSATRAVAADPDTTPRLAQVVARLGEPLYLHVAPDGYPEREAAWVNSGALLDRMNAAVALAAGKLQGVTVVLDSVVSTGDADQLVDAVNEKILGGTMSENTKQVLRRQVADISNPTQARALAVGLAIGGPEFQRQ